MAGIFIYRWQKGWVIWAKVTQLLSSRIGIRPGSIQATCSTLCCDDVNKEETPGTGFKTPVLYTSTKLASSLLLLGNCWGYVLGVASTFSIHSMAETHIALTCLLCSFRWNVNCSCNLHFWVQYSFFFVLFCTMRGCPSSFISLNNKDP